METKELDNLQVRELEVKRMQENFQSGERSLAFYMSRITDNSFAEFIWYSGKFDKIYVGFQTYPKTNLPVEVNVNVTITYSNKPTSKKIHTIKKGDYLRIKPEQGITSVTVIYGNGSGIPQTTNLICGVSESF